MEGLLAREMNPNFFNIDEEPSLMPGEEGAEESSNDDSWADCISLDADGLLDLDYKGIDWDLSGGLDQHTSLEDDQLEEMMVAAGKEPSSKTEESRTRVIQSETQKLPLSLQALPVISLPPVEGPISPEASGLDPVKEAPAFTPLDEIVERATLTDPEIQGILSDLHGITTGIESLQVDDLKATSRPAILSRLEDEVYKLPVERKVAYCQAVIKCPGLLSDERKMSFLEREDGDPALAAARLALYWEFRLETFGPERCFLPMTLNGAMKSEAENMVRFPIHQLLPVKDTAGRAVWYFDPSHRDFEKYSIEQEFMALWYLLDVASEDPEVLKNGLVAIGNLQQVEMKQYKRKSFYTVLEQAIPMHFRAVHLCHLNVAAYYVMPVVMYIMARKHRQRLRLHRGSEAEVLQELEKFCLPRDRLPTELGGEVVLDMVKFLVDRMALEGSRPDPRLALDQSPISVPQGPATKRSRGDHSATDVNISKLKSGRKSDPRMLRAIDIRLTNPDLPLVEVLDMAGFRFDSKNENGAPVDADNVTLKQRKNNLCRRVRLEKARLEQEGAGAMEAEEDSSNTGALPNATFSADDSLPGTGH